MVGSPPPKTVMPNAEEETGDVGEPRTSHRELG